MITLKHLRYFVLLAHHQHFGRAAEACAITQPALSLQMKELQDILGVPLLERDARKIRLTAFGESFALRAQRILDEVNELHQFARATRGPLQGVLRLGIIPTVAPYLLPHAMRRLMGEFPNLDIRPREAVTPKLLSDLNDGKLDAAIIALPSGGSTFEEMPLFEEDFVLVRPASEANLPVPNANQLGQMRLLLLEEGHCFREQALDFCAMPNKTPRDIMEGSSLSTLVQMVNVGIGVTLIPRLAVPHEAAHANVALADLPEPRPKRRIGMVWRRSNPLGPHLREIAGQIAAVHQEMF